MRELTISIEFKKNILYHVKTLTRMDISTICETKLIRKIMQRIGDGNDIDEKTIVKEIQIEPIIFSILTIDMNDPSLQNATDEQKRTLLSVILQLYPSALIFCQEVPENFEEVVPADKADFKIDTKHEKSTAVIWATEQFTKSDPEEKRRFEEKLKYEIGEEIMLWSRISMVKLTSTEEPTYTTLAVSYHGPHTKRNKKEKINLLLRLLTFLNEAKEEENDVHSFIVGGDFNLNTTQINNLCDRLRVKVGEYNLSKRAETKREKNRRYIPYKDNFFWSTGITINGIKAKECEFKEFDHDPVVGDLVLQPYKKPKDSKKRGAGTSPTR